MVIRHGKLRNGFPSLHTAFRSVPLATVRRRLPAGWFSQGL